MNLIRRIVAAILVLLVAAVFVFSFGFYFGDAWFPGHYPSIFVGMYAHLWLPATVVLAVICLVWVLKRRTKPAKLAIVLSLAALVCSAMGTVQMVSAMNEVGKSADFLACYFLRDTSSVKTMDATYGYGVDGPLGLTVYYTEDYAPNAPTQKPVILYTHGGGWIIGNRFERDYDCKVLAQEGFVVVSWDYDLSTWERHLWDVVENEAIDAITWVRDNAYTFGASTERFYMIGDSAGGHLTLDVSYKINSGLYYAADGTALPAVDAVCCNYPVVSPTTFWEFDGTFLWGDGRPMVEKYIGGTPEERQEAILAIEPSLYVSESTPPTLILVPGSDSLVPAQTSYDLVSMLTDRGLTAAAVSVPHANHAFDYVPNNLGDQAYLTYVLYWCNKYQ